MAHAIPSTSARLRPRRHGRTAVLATLAGGLFLAVAVQAAPGAQLQPGEAVYRCRSATGQMFVGQSIPAECMDQDVDVLDASGRVVRKIPGRGSMDALAQEKAAADAKAAQAQRDRTLLATYLTVADIERLRDQRLELLEQQNVVTRQYIANLRAREERLMTSVQEFRPYNAKPDAPPLPEQIASEIVNTVKGLQVYEQELTKNTAERERVTNEFASDIARFKELKGIK